MTALLPGQVAAPEGPADVRKLYVIHNGFRRDLACFTAAARLLRLWGRVRFRRLQRAAFAHVPSGVGA